MFSTTFSLPQDHETIQVNLIISDKILNQEQEQNAPLGTYAKSATTSTKPMDFKSSNIRSLRYALQDKIQKLLFNHSTDHQFKNVKKCMRTSHTTAVTIHKEKQRNKAFYGNLIQCANVWACPVCSAKIQAKRALEISKAVFHAYHNNKKAIMITLTQPHTKHETLASIVDKHKVAMNKFKSGNRFSLFTKRTGCYGKIRSTEVTYSNHNGWHYHVHELWLVDQSCDINSEIAFLKRKWFNACTSAGFTINNELAFFDHALDIMDNAHTSDYLAKSGQHWGADKELTGGANKKGHGKTPFDLADSTNHNDQQLFIEYLNATRGKAQIYWSPKLKALVGVKNKTDQELTEEQTEKAELIAFLKREVWLQILHNKSRAALLTIVEEGGYNGLAEWLRRQYNYSLEPPV